MVLRGRSVVVLLSLAVLGGCRFKAGESFMSATEPNPRFDAAKSDWKGDPYAASSLAESSGGTKPSTTYVSRAGASDGQKVDPTVNRPGYGGESPATNAPAQQPLGQ